ncbi:hypothetical protein ABZ570_09805 [Micromonospora sp. NPDC007271]|uniref:hypothetical protein n=1 Tax=Micromonospora sp. NPDC007271 TaxID=3154587 RepID=UPI0033ECCFC4
MDERATRREQLLTRVAQALPPGETVREACWFSRVPGRRSAGEVLRAELNPARVVEGLAWDAVGMTASTGPDVAWYQAARGGVLGGAPGSAAAVLDGRLPEPAVVQVLAVTDRRMLVLAPRRVASDASPVAAAGGLRERLTAAARQVRAAWQGPGSAGPAAPLDLTWEIDRAGVARADAMPGNQLGRLALLFTDGSWIVVGPPDEEAARVMAAALG